jgi:hypothetical protein
MAYLKYAARPREFERDVAGQACVLVANTMCGIDIALVLGQASTPTVNTGGDEVGRAEADTDSAPEFA